MPSIDLRNFVLTRSGRWTEESELAKSYQPGYLALRKTGDKVTLKGPLYARVTRNVEYPPAPGASSATANVLSKGSYTISIPPGQTWSYTFSDDDLAMVSDEDKQRVSVAIEPLSQIETSAHNTSMAYVYAPNAGLGLVNEGWVATGPQTGGGTFTQPISSCDVAQPIILDPFYPPGYAGYGPNISPCSHAKIILFPLLSSMSAYS